MDTCNCTMSISVLGDGCRYCQPQEYIDRLHDTIEAEREDYEEELNALQAKLDEVMLEYCPEEMTEEQVAVWESHQQPVKELDPDYARVMWEVLGKRPKISEGRLK